jgi:hypothetical protein
MKLRFLLVAVLLSLVALSAAQTNLNSVPADFPLSLWMQHKHVTQIPWKVSVGKANYRSDLRQELQITVLIRTADLEKSGDSHDLVIFTRVLDGTMPITPIQSVQRSTRGLLLPLVALVRPGKYKLEAGLLDRATGRISTLYEDFSVSGNESDPLERALQRYPRFEFVNRAKIEDRVLPSVLPRGTAVHGVSIGAPSGSVIEANLSGRDFGVSSDPPPSFVVDKRTPMHLSVITIVSPPELALDDAYYLSLFQTNLTTFLSAFSHLDVIHGTSQLTGVDLTNRTLVFDRRDIREVTHEMLGDAINKDASTVSVEALAGKADRGRFFRDVLRTQFEEAEKEATGVEHVIIVVAARSTFPKGSSVPPLSPERDCHCHVIYVRFALQPNESDDIEGLLKAYKPRVFDPLDWQEFRKDFASIYEQLLR